MKLKVVAKDCEIVKTGSEPINDKNGNYTGSDWHRAIVCQGFNTETLTVDKTVINLLKVGSKMDLIIDITPDSEKAWKTKYKVVGIDKQILQKEATK